MQEVKKLYDLTYDIVTKKDEYSYELPYPVLKIVLLDEYRKIVGFNASTPTEEICIEIMAESVPVILSIIGKMKEDLEKEQLNVLEKVQKENTRKIIINIKLSEELLTERFDEFEKDLIALLDKYGLKGKIENFTTGKVFDFPVIKKQIDYKV